MCARAACRAAYFRQRYARLWLFARVRGAYEPLAVLFACLWLSYSTWDTAQRHLTQAAILGAILGANFLLAVFLLTMGLAVGGRWREMPRHELGPRAEARNGARRTCGHV